MSWDFLGLEEAIVFCNFEESERICLGNFLVLRRQMFIAILWNGGGAIPNFNSRDGRRGIDMVEKQDGIRLPCS